MKIWKSLLVILLLSLLGWGGYELYQKFILSRKINSLELISSDAVFIFETERADQTWNEFVNQPAWGVFSKFPAFQSLASQLTSLDSISGGNGFISKTLRNKQVTVSYHATGVDNFSLLYTINFGSSSPAELLEELKSKVPSQAKFQSRKYSDQEILEYVDASNAKQWSITVLNNVLLISSSSFVIEEAIRFFLSDNPNRLSDKLGDQLSADYEFGRLILTSKGIGKLLSGVSSSRESLSIQEFNLSEQIAIMELSFEENQLVFKGPLVWEEEVNFLPSVKAQFPEFEKLISNRTQAITQINLGGIFEAQKLQNPGFVSKSTISGEIQSRLIDRGFLDNFSGEMYFLELEPLGNQLKNLALLIQTTQPEQTWAFLKEFRSNTEIQAGDFYRENEILFFPEEEFPAHIFNGKFTGFEQTHISLIGDILILTNNAPGMKMVLDDYFQGNTWSRKSPENGSKAVSPSSGFSKTFFIPKIWGKWIQSSNPTWSTFLQKYASEFQHFQWLKLAIHQQSSGPVVSLTLNFFGDKSPEKAEKKSFELIAGKQFLLPEALVYGPKSVKNFNDNSEDLILQDLNHHLYLINSAGEQVFSQTLSGPIISDVFQIDFYKNGKLQILFATSDRLYAIDRLGNFIPGFPLSIPGEKISQLNLVDYEQSREYRYFISTEKGNLWLLDKTGKQLEGWNPLSLGESTLGAPFHIRVPGKGDFMVAQGNSGKVFFFNRRGEHQPGSPLSLGGAITTPLRITQGNSTFISAVTQNGEVIGASFSGEILYRNQLVKNNRDDRFDLISDQLRQSFLILVRQFNKTIVLNDKEETLISLPISDEKAWFGYFDFGSNRKILAVTDPEQGFGYLYDLAGNLLTNTPLESEGEIQITHRPSLSQLIIRTRSGSKVFEYVIPD
ncbi:hypothetical protein [Algoriphagus sp. AK58]|uniref:hypothetical protein n=1 Tax=Algoriphagus sp. AK58 TaxID=1406877 RepID=UPI00164F574B|nr:hypothetical protein [Algoriphagus sp. AK58]MBC6367077.1 hypothetical protein [Algoriphagus sp. AK58]